MASKKKFDLKKTAAQLWEKPAVKIYLAVVFFALCSAVSITVYVQLKGQADRRDARTQVNSYSMEELNAQAQRPGLQNLVITNRWENKDWLEPEPYREPQNRWDSRDIARFWIPPSEIDLQSLTKDNMLRLKNKLKDVP